MWKVVTFACAGMLALPALAQEKSAEDIRAEARETFGAALPELENYPDSMVSGAWVWMNDVEDGEGAIDAKTMQLIGLAVAAQIPCQFCTYYHRKAALALGATEQEVAEAAAIAGYVRNWSTVLYGTGADLATYQQMVDGLFASE